MINKLRKNWLVLIFFIAIYLGCLLTIVLKCRPIGASVYHGIYDDYKVNGVHVETVSNSVSVIENSFTQNLFGKSYWIEVLGLFNQACHKSVFLDTEDRYTVYKMSNGQETWNYRGYDVGTYAEHYKVFAENLKSERIPLLFVQAPFKINKYNNELPYGMTDETNALADSFLSQISDCDTFDLRQVIEEEKIDYDSLFYATDHHWTPKTGLWATGVIAQRIKSEYRLDLDTSFLDPGNYEYTVYSKFFLGSQGKRAGIIYSGLDDFTLIEPKYETNYHVNIPTLNISKEGDFSETLLFKEYLKKDYYNGDPGRVYTGDNYSLMTVQNYNAKNHTKILLVKDSFSKSVIPFLSSTCSELHVIDLRTFEGSVRDYAIENKMNMVIVLYNPSVVTDEHFFEF